MVTKTLSGVHLLWLCGYSEHVAAIKSGKWLVCCISGQFWMSSLDFSLLTGQGWATWRRFCSQRFFQLLYVGLILHTAAPRARETGCLIKATLSNWAPCHLPPQPLNDGRSRATALVYKRFTSRLYHRFKFQHRQHAESKNCLSSSCCYLNFGNTPVTVT